ANQRDERAALHSITSSAMASNTRGRLSQQLFSRRPAPSHRGVSTRPQRDRLRRGPQPRDRIPVSGQSIGAAGAAGGRSDRSQRRRHRGGRRQQFGAGRQAVTSTIPILFTSGLDPVKAGLVSSSNRPGANVTGVSWFSAELGSKHLEVLNE